MSHNYKWTWDVRNTVPPHTDSTISDPSNVDETYQQINLMVFLLDGIPFDILLGDIDEWIDAMIHKVDQHWPDNSFRPGSSTDFPPALRTLLLPVLREVKTKSAGRRILFRTFWDTFLDDITHENQRHREIFDQFNILRNDATYRKRFCLPFILIQQDQSATRSTVPKTSMDGFIAAIRGYSNADLYMKSSRFHPELAAAAQLGKSYRILNVGACCSMLGDGSDSDDEELRMLGGGGSNNRVCHTGLSTCVSQTGSTCTADSNGYCTIG